MARKTVEKYYLILTHMKNMYLKKWDNEKKYSLDKSLEM